MNYVPSIETLQQHLVDRLPATATDLAPSVDVTVVTVCYNPIENGRKDLLLHNLQSVQQQRGIVLEHLIIDGASTDGTQQLILGYSNPTHTIRFFSQKDSGIYEAMNRGIALARGRYVIFLNSDDYYHNPHGLATSLAAIEQTDCAFSFSPIRVVGPHSSHSPHKNPQRRLHKFCVFCTIPHPSELFRRDVLIQMGGYDQRYRSAADYDLMLRIVGTGHKVLFVDNNFATFNMGGYTTHNRQLGLKEKAHAVLNFHNTCLHAQITESQALQLVTRCVYPRQFLQLYKDTQRLVAQSFVGLPDSLADRFIRRFNYAKYLVKCVLSS